jgi:phosphocarrier protein HPr
MNDATPGKSSEEVAAASATARRVAKICNQKGLHARAAARFVKTAHSFNAEIWVRKNGTIVSGRSIMGLMMLAAASGTELEISAAGREADDAVRTLAHLVECKFDED